MNEEKFIVKKPEESDFEAIFQFHRKEFRPRECLNIVSGLNREDFEADTTVNRERKSFFRRWLLDGVSLIALDKEDGTLAGIAINCITKKNGADWGYTQISGPLKAVLKFLGKLEEGHDIFSELETDQGLELIFLCVKEKYSKQGIARKLTEQTLEIAKELQLKFVQSIPSSPATIHLFESLGFITRSEMRCIDFRMEDGSPGFPYAEPNDRSRYVVKIF